MKFQHIIAIFVFLISSCSVLFAQESIEFNKESVTERLRADISILASDSFKGRAAGSKGEQLAAAYIIEQLKITGLSPYFGDTSFTQKFTSSYLIFGGRNCNLYINDLYIPKGNKKNSFYPLAYTGTGTVEGELIDVNFGIHAPQLNYNDYEKIQNLQGKIAVIETSIPGGYSASSSFESYRYIRGKIDTAASYGASAIIFVNSDPNYQNPTNELNLSVLRREIPIIFYTGKKADLFKEISFAKLNVELTFFQTTSAMNVAGVINNNAEKTVIIGAHYDHLGVICTSSGDSIANGADDNASGTAGVLELARYIQNNELKHYNYVFVLFSGEENGLLGSKHFSNFNSTGFENIAFMLNLDMIGRSGCKKADLIIYAVGSSNSWKKQLKKGKSILKKVNYIAGSNGGSDHHSFYKKGIPALFFFTGIHDDYHEVSDEADLINFSGSADIISYVEALIVNMEQCPVPKFRKVGPLRNGISYLGIIFR